MEDAAFDTFVAHLDYPMFVLTAPGGAGARPSGCLVGFATQCSLDPPRFLVCVSRSNHTFGAVATASCVGLHVLGPEDRQLAELFGTTSGDSVDKFARCRWRAGPCGVPILADCVGWLVGRIRDRPDLGDHVGLVLDPVLAGERRAGAAMMYSAVRDLRAGHPT